MTNRHIDKETLDWLIDRLNLIDRTLDTRDNPTCLELRRRVDIAEGLTAELRDQLGN